MCVQNIAYIRADGKQFNKKHPRGHKYAKRNVYNTIKEKKNRSSDKKKKKRASLEYAISRVNIKERQRGRAAL